MRFDSALIEIALNVVWNQDHHGVGGLRGIRRGEDAQTRRCCFDTALARFWEPDHHIETRVAQIQRVGVALAAVANDCDCLSFEEADVAVLFVITCCHLFN